MADEELIIRRIFDAPREEVWRAWTDPETVKCWFGPEGYTTPVVQIDLREGGMSLYDMRSPDGKDIWSGGEFIEIIPLERIVVTDYFSDSEGNPVSPSEYGMTGEWPDQLLVTATFEDYGQGKTKLILRHMGFPDEENRDGACEGWSESLDKMARCVESQMMPMG